MGLIFQIQSILILGLMALGIQLRRERQKHVRIMGTVITWDILLILQIELSRHAIMKATNAVIGLSRWPLLIHLFFALSTVVIYGLMIYTGRKILAGKDVAHYRPRHKFLGYSVFLLRILTFITSFFVKFE